MAEIEHRIVPVVLVDHFAKKHDIGDLKITQHGKFDYSTQFTHLYHMLEEYCAEQGIKIKEELNNHKMEVAFSDSWPASFKVTLLPFPPKAPRCG